MAKKKRIYRRHGVTVPVAVALGFVPLTVTGYNAVKAGGVTGLQNIVTSLVPYNFSTHSLDFSQLGSGLYPILAGMFVHKFVGGALGVNRMLASSRVPFVRI